MPTRLTAPLSPAQELLCWVDEVAPGRVSGGRFAIVAGYRISGRLDVALFQAALDDLVVRHEALRTVILRDGPVPRQEVLPPAPVRLAVVAADRVLESAVAANYPATEVPLLWAFLGQDEADATLVLVGHHMVTDSWSIGLLMADLMAGYAERAAGGRPGTDAPRYADSGAAAHRRYDERRRALLTPHWQRVFDDPPSLPVPEATGGPVRMADRGFPVRATDNALVDAAKALRTTPFVLALAAFMSALHAACGAEDVMVPVLTYGRDRSDWNTVGLFMNVLPVRVNLAGASEVETVRRVHRTFAEAFVRELPLADVVSGVPEAARFFAPGGPVSAHFDVTRLPDTGPAPLRYRPALLPVPVPLDDPVLPVNGMAVWLEPHADGGYGGKVRYRADLFTASTVDAIGQHLARALDVLTQR